MKMLMMLLMMFFDDVVRIDVTVHVGECDVDDVLLYVWHEVDVFYYLSLMRLL